MGFGRATVSSESRVPSPPPRSQPSLFHVSAITGAGLRRMLGRQKLPAAKRGSAPISEMWAHVPAVAHNRASDSRPALLFAANMQFGDRGELIDEAEVWQHLYATIDMIERDAQRPRSVRLRFTAKFSKRSPCADGRDQSLVATYARFPWPGRCAFPHS
jgi:hypothetical protein